MLCTQQGTSNKIHNDYVTHEHISGFMLPVILRRQTKIIEVC